MNEETVISALPVWRVILRRIFITLGMLIGILIGSFAFLIGFLTQCFARRKLPDALLLLQGAGVFLIVWKFTSMSYGITAPDMPEWLSLCFNSVISAAFSQSGGFLCRAMFSGRYRFAE